MRQGKHQVWSAHSLCAQCMLSTKAGESGGSVVERTPEREVRGSKPTSAVLCP